MTKSPKLLDQVRDKLRVEHYAIRTEQSYVDWIKHCISLHGNLYSTMAWLAKFNALACRSPRGCQSKTTALLGQLERQVRDNLN